MSGIYVLMKQCEASFVQRQTERLRTRWTGKILVLCIFEGDYVCLSVMQHSFLAVCFPMAPSAECSPNFHRIFSCIWASNCASHTETHTKHFRSIRANSVVRPWKRRPKRIVYLQINTICFFNWVLPCLCIDIYMYSTQQTTNIFTNDPVHRCHGRKAGDDCA